MLPTPCFPSLVREPLRPQVVISMEQPGERTTVIHRAALCTALLATAVAAAPASAASMSWTVPLKGEAEVPGPGSTDGAGIAVISVDNVANTVCYSMSVVRIGTVAGAHVHSGVAGAEGAPIVPLEAPVTNGMTKGCTPVDHDVATAILANPAGYYVNVHTADFPKGALRGQLAAN